MVSRNLSKPLDSIGCEAAAMKRQSARSATIIIIMTTDYENLQEGIRELELPPIECFRNIYADRDYRVRLEIQEFNSICPKTGLPDFGTIDVEYVPDELLAEMKSLKLYITAFRNVGIFQENVVNRLLDDFVSFVKPRSVTITGTFRARGGIATVVRASRP